MNSDPRETISQSSMGILQMLIIAVMVGLNGLDGFDILSISFAAPEIAKEWGISQTALGIVLSMELIGMGLGSFFLGTMADKVGRRPTAMFCLLAMALGMFMVTATSSIIALSVWRIVTGVGIGGLLTAITSLTAEYSNSRRQHLCISIMAIGYPIGGVIGSAVSSMLLASYDWRSIFYLGTTVTLLFIPVFYFIVPESVHWLIRKQPSGALKRINRTLKKLKHKAIDALPEISPDTRKKSVSDIFSPALLPATLIISITYFLHITSYYFILKWVPKIVADMDFASSSAAGVLGWGNVGGALGGITFGFLTLKINLKRLTVATLFFAAVFIALFGRSPEDLNMLSLFCAMAGFFGNAGIIGLYAIFAYVFPTHARAFGAGFVIGVGRGGSILSPFLAGILLDTGMKLQNITAVMCLGALIGGIVLAFLKLRPEEPSEGSKSKSDEKNIAVEPSLAEEV